MLIIKKLGYLVFGIFAVADITLIAVGEERFRFLTKPFLLPVLLLIILVQSAGQKHPIAKKLVFIALVAGTVGDILLMKSDINPNYFTFGLAAFLVMQLFYTLYFFRMQGLKKEFVIINLFIALLITGFSFVLVGSLWNYLGKLQWPVALYAFFISLMLFAATNVYHSKRAQKLALQFFIPGAAFLVVSDSILAVNKFYLKDDLFNISVMVTYILGQLFLSMGFVKHLKSGRGSKHKHRRTHREQPENDAEPA